MNEAIDEICAAINDADDVNHKLAMLGAVLESIVVTEVKPAHRAEAVDKFCGIVRSRVAATLN